MGFLALMFGVLAWFCLGIGVVTLLGFLGPLRAELTWYVWLAFSALLFLASIAAGMGKRHGGGEY